MKYGQAPKPTIEAKHKSEITTEEWNRYFTGHWNFAGEKQDKHLAMFPEELPKRLIKMFSFAGETVLDPFLGSGMTMLAAKNLNRNSIGYEINSSFLPAIKERTSFNQQDKLKPAKFEIVKQDKFRRDFNREIKELPYIFKDHIKFDKKIDPKNLKYGSKIDGTESKREDYYTVKEIISPELMKLGNGLIIRLLGIKEDPSKNGKASEFLVGKTQGKQVFLKYDQQKYDSNNHLMAYVYLKNKTFINTHLLKHGFVKPDHKIVHRYMNKFKELSQHRVNE